MTESAGLKDLKSLENYFSSVKPYLLYREEDDVLIIPPNRVFKLNSTGGRLFRWLESGRSLSEIPDLDPGKIGDIDNFMRSIQDAVEGRYPDTLEQPYTFDYTRLPVLGEIAVTKRCNNFCRFCYAGCGTEMNKTSDLPAGKIKRIIRIFKDKAKIPFFSFTGGEPLLRRDLESLVKYAVKSGLRTNLISNGTLVTGKRAESLYRAGLRTAQISLESPDEENHDRLCGRKGSWEKTIAGIKHLQDAGISVQTNTTICALNADDALSMPAFLAGLGIKRFSMNMYIPAVKNKSAEKLFIPYADIGTVVRKLRKNAAENNIVFYWYSPTPFCHFNPIAEGLGNKSCAAMDGLISVDYNGDVLPCSSYEEPMGNLLEKSFNDIWFSDRASWFKQKKYAPPECEGCTSFTACQAACPIYWKYRGCSEIKNPVRESGRKRIVS